MHKFLFSHLTHFRSLGQKSKKKIVRFLIQMRIRKFAFEIYWPLNKGYVAQWSEISSEGAFVFSCEILFQFYICIVI